MNNQQLTENPQGQAQTQPVPVVIAQNTTQNQTLLSSECYCMWLSGLIFGIFSLFELCCMNPIYSNQRRRRNARKIYF